MKRMNGFRKSAGVKEGPANCIRTDEDAAALIKMIRQSLRLSQLAAEIIRVTGDTGTLWILDLRNGIVFYQQNFSVYNCTIG